jgi:hypothetical protein
MRDELDLRVEFRIRGDDGHVIYGIEPECHGIKWLFVRAGRSDW